MKENSGSWKLWLVAILGGICLLTSGDLSLFLVRLVIIAGIAGWLYMRQQNQLTAQKPITTLPSTPPPPQKDIVLKIDVPRNQVWQPESAIRLVKAVLTHCPPSEGFVWFLIATDGEMTWWSIEVKGTTAETQKIRSAVMSFYPQAETEVLAEIEVPAKTPNSPPEDQTPALYSMLARNAGIDYFLPLVIPSEIRSPDPLAHLAQVMEEVRPGDYLAYAVTVYGQKSYTPEEIKKLLTQTMSEAGESLPRYTYTHKNMSEAFGEGVARGILEATKRVPKFTPTEERKHRAKLEQGVYLANVNLLYRGPDPQRLLTSAMVPIQSLTNPLYPMFAGAETGTFKQVDETLGNRGVFYLTPEEIAALWHLPHEEFSAPRISWVLGRYVPAPQTVIANKTGICLGDNRHREEKTPIFLKTADRDGHMITFGKTGVGKSTFLHHLIHQDIASGCGVAVIDPHGDLVNDILDKSIPPERVGDVVVWDIANRQNPPPLNLLALPSGIDPSVAVGRIMGVFERIWPDFGATQMADTLSMALETLTAEETPTLLDVARLFREDEYRWQLARKADNPEVVGFWEDFEGQKGGRQNDMVYPVLRRLRSFYGSKALRPILCHPGNLDIPTLIGEKKIILVSLHVPDGMQLPDQSQELLGAIWISLFQLAVMARAAREPYYLYIDEAQNFVTTSIPGVLNEARKRNLRLTLSNQFLGQLHGDTLKSVMGNVGAMVVFQCGLEDARAVGPYFKPGFAPEDLVALDKFHAAVSMRVDGSQQPGFSLSTRLVRKDSENKDAAVDAQKIREQSVRTYTPKSLEDIETWLNERYGRRRGAESSGQGSDDDFSEPV